MDGASGHVGVQARGDTDRERNDPGRRDPFRIEHGLDHEQPLPVGERIVLGAVALWIGCLGRGQRAVGVRDADRDLPRALPRQAQVLEVADVKRLEAAVDDREGNGFPSTGWAHAMPNCSLLAFDTGALLGGSSRPSK